MERGIATETAAPTQPRLDKSGESRHPPTTPLTPIYQWTDAIAGARASSGRNDRRAGARGGTAKKTGSLVLGGPRRVSELGCERLGRARVPA